MSKGNKNRRLLVIDPNKDFMGHDDGTPLVEIIYQARVETADLPVPGAIWDMRRLADFVFKNIESTDDMDIFLDSHNTFDVGHASMWKGRDGNPPPKFTDISEEDLQTGVWTTRNPKHLKRMVKYAHALEATPGHYKIKVWSEVAHCGVGTWGHSIYNPLADAISMWSQANTKAPNCTFKGLDPWTEHYGILMAEVPNPHNAHTLLNRSALRTFVKADIIAVAGQAGNVCVWKSMLQVAEHLPEKHLKKFHILSDCMSPIPGLIPMEDVFKQLKNFGMTITTSKEFKF